MDRIYGTRFEDEEADLLSHHKGAQQVRFVIKEIERRRELERLSDRAIEEADLLCHHKGAEQVSFLFRERRNRGIEGWRDKAIERYSDTAIER